MRRVGWSVVAAAGVLIETALMVRAMKTIQIIKSIFLARSISTLSSADCCIHELIARMMVRGWNVGRNGRLMIVCLCVCIAPVSC